MGIFSTGITRPRDFCELCTTVPATGTSVVCDTHTRTRNFWKFCTPVPQRPGVRVQHVYTCPELLEVLCARATIPGRSGSFVRLSYPYPELLEILKDFHTRTRNFWKFCKTFIPVPGTSVSSARPVPQYPGYGYIMFFTRPEVL